MKSSLNPIQQHERIHVLDSIRGFALLSILLMNIPFFGLPVPAAESLNIRNEYTGMNYYTWWLMRLFFAGSMRGLFSMLFGAGMLLLTDRLSRHTHIDSAAEIYYRRLIWLLLFGLVDAFLIMWAGDILYMYAICGLFLYPLRRLKPKHLFLIAGIILVLHTVKTTYYEKAPLRLQNKVSLIQKMDSAQLSAGEKSVQAQWDGYVEKVKIETKREEAEKEIRAKKGSLSEAFLFNANDSAMVETKFFYHFIFTGTLLFMILGMALFKLGVFTGERSRQFYLLLSVAGYLVAFPLSYWDAHTTIVVRFEGIKYWDYIPFDLYEIRRLGLTLGHLGLFMLVYKLGWFRFLFRAWGKVGQMAFSNYLLQNMICSVLFYGWGFNWFNELERYQLYFVVAAVWLVNIGFSYLWLHYFHIGPFEWIWRSLTYWNQQTIRKPSLPKVLALE